MIKFTIMNINDDNNRRSWQELAKRYRDARRPESYYGSGREDILGAISRYQVIAWDQEGERINQRRAAGETVEDSDVVQKRIDDLFMQGKEISIKKEIVDDMIARGFLVERDFSVEKDWKKKWVIDREAKRGKGSISRT
jgi:hypothetical protein